MADITLATATDGNDFSGGLDNGIVWVSSTVGYFFYIDVTSVDLEYVKTTDGGASWGSAVSVTTDNIGRFAVWYDQWTNGNTGSLIHIARITKSNAELQYEQLDTSDDSQSGTLSIVSTSTLDINADWRTSGVSICVARGGNVYIAAVARNDAVNLYRENFYRSTDGGTSFGSRGVPWENTGDAARTDRIILMPGGETDNNDIIGIFYDDSNTELSLKTYDDTANSWSEGSISIDVDVSTGGDVGLGFSAVPRHSDNGTVVIASSTQNAATHDIHAWEILGGGTINTLTDVFTDNDNHHLDCALFIDQNTDNLYAVYIGSIAEDETPFTSVSVYYQISQDDGATWDGEVQLDEDTAAIHRAVWTGVSVGSGGGRFQPCWSEDSTSASPDEYKTNVNNSIAIASTIPAGLELSTSIIVDWDADGTFDADEEISQDVLRASWVRGKEPEQETTPVGTGQIVVSDPNGYYLPNSTFWDDSPGDLNVKLNREVKATVAYDGNTYPLFRLRINAIRANTRPGNDQTVTLFCVDEKEILANKFIASPYGPEIAGGASSCGDDPVEGFTMGTTGDAGVLRSILDESSIADDRRVIAETGTTADLWWTYGDAKSAVDEVERHEGKFASLYVNSCGSIEFHSSTHREGVAVAAKFGVTSEGGDATYVPLQAIEFEQSARDVLNSANVKIFSYVSEGATVQFVPEPGRIITVGSTYTWTVEVDNAPPSAIIIPDAEADSTSGVSIVGETSGTTYTDADTSGENFVKATVLGGGSAVRFAVGNFSTIAESIRVKHPSTDAGYSGTTSVFPMLVQLHQVSPIEFNDCDPTSITTYGKRFKEISLPFFGVLDGDPNLGKASDRATAEIEHSSSAHPNGMRISLAGSDSNSITQILSRDMDDRIELSDTRLNLSNSPEFYITKGEWNLDAGGHIGVTWTLQEAT